MQSVDGPMFTITREERALIIRAIQGAITVIDQLIDEMPNTAEQWHAKVVYEERRLAYNQMIYVLALTDPAVVEL